MQSAAKHLARFIADAENYCTTRDASLRSA
jgi:hypothetical protein